MMRFSLPEENGSCDTTFWHECIYQANEVNYYPFGEFTSEEIENLFLDLVAARNESRESQNYTKTWVLPLHEEMEYGDIVYLLNLCMKYDVKRFQLDIYKDNFAFQEVYNEKKDSTWEYEEPIFWDCVVHVEAERSAFEKIEAGMTDGYNLNTKEDVSVLLELLGLYLFFCGLVFIIKR